MTVHPLLRVRSNVNFSKKIIYINIEGKCQKIFIAIFLKWVCCFLIHSLSRRNLTEAWKIELELQNKAELAAKIPADFLPDTKKLLETTIEGQA